MREILGGLLFMEIQEYKGLDDAFDLPGEVTNWDFAAFKAPGNVEEFSRELVRYALSGVDQLGYNLPWLYPATSLAISFGSMVSPVPIHIWINPDTMEQIEAIREMHIRIDAAKARGLSLRSLRSYKKQMYLHGFAVILHWTGMTGMAWRTFRARPMILTERPVREFHAFEPDNPGGEVPGQWFSLTWFFFSQWVADSRVGRIFGSTGKILDNTLTIAENLAKATVTVTAVYAGVPWEFLAIMGIGIVGMKLYVSVEDFILGREGRRKKRPRKQPTAATGAGGGALMPAPQGGGWRDYLVTLEGIVTSGMALVAMVEITDFLWSNLTLFGTSMGSRAAQSSSSSSKKSAVSNGRYGVLL